MLLPPLTLEVHHAMTLIEGIMQLFITYISVKLLEIGMTTVALIIKQTLSLQFLKTLFLIAIQLLEMPMNQTRNINDLIMVQLHIKYINFTKGSST